MADSLSLGRPTYTWVPGTTYSGTLLVRCGKCRNWLFHDDFYRHQNGRHPNCKLCVKTDANRWARANPHRRRMIRIDWNARHKAERRLASQRLRERKKAEDLKGLRDSERSRAGLWRLKNPRKHAQILRRCHLKRIARDPLRERLRGHLAAVKRRQRLSAAGDGYSAQDIRLLLINQGNQCWWCPAELNGVYHIDHRFALARGGRHDASNIVLSCPSCNLRKGARLPWHFAGRLL